MMASSQSTQSIKARFARTFLAHAADRGITDPRYYDLVFGVCEALRRKRGERGERGGRDESAESAEPPAPPVLRVSGGQGSGKSAVAEFVRFVLESCFGERAAVLSLDDFYLPRAERARLASEVHPLLSVRGVPGTHDVPLMLDAISALRRGGAAATPVFNKATDDREPELATIGPVDAIITEGWCMGVTAQPPAALVDPVNDLERLEDSDGAWRRHVNRQLESVYPPLFACDLSLFLAVPSMDAVVRWRLQQERELQAAELHAAELRSLKGGALLDESGVKSFVAFYERITRWMLHDLPGTVDVLARLDERHRIAGLTLAGSASIS